MCIACNIDLANSACVVLPLMFVNNLSVVLMFMNVT